MVEPLKNLLVLDLDGLLQRERNQERSRSHIVQADPRGQHRARDKEGRYRSMELQIVAQRASCEPQKGVMEMHELGYRGAELALARERVMDFDPAQDRQTPDRRERCMRADVART